MRQRNMNILLISLFCLFVIGILLGSRYHPQGTKLMTIHIEGLEEDQAAEQIESIVELLEGVQTIFVDEKSKLFTFRYDSGKISYRTVESKLSGFGLTVTPVKSVRLLDQKYSPQPKDKLFKIEISSPNQN